MEKTKETIFDLLKLVTERTNEVCKEFVESGKAMDLRLGMTVDESEITPSHYENLLNYYGENGETVVGEELQWDIEDNCPPVYYEQMLGDTPKHGYCVAVSVEGNIVKMLVYDDVEGDFVLLHRHEIVEGFDWVMGKVELVMSEENKAPELTATTLTASCYSTMFQNCGGLNKSKEDTNQ